MAWQCCINNWVKQCDLWTADVFAFPNNDKCILVSSLLMESNHLVRADCDARRIAHRELWTLQMPFIRVGIVYANEHEEISKSLSHSSWPSWVRVATVQSEADSCRFIWFGAAWIIVQCLIEPEVLSGLGTGLLVCCKVLQSFVVAYYANLLNTWFVSQFQSAVKYFWIMSGELCITDCTSSLLRVK